MDILPPSSRVIEETRAALLCNLPPGGGEIVRSLGISSYLECATVAAGERVSGRVIVRGAEPERVIELVRGLGACCERGRFRLLRAKSPVEGTDHRGAFVGDDVADALPILYLGINPAFARGAEQAEAAGEHAVLGRLLGYPECCVEAFRAGESGVFDRLPSTIPSIGPFPAAMNPVVPYLVGFSVLFHFPCSPHCGPSLELLRARQRFLARLSPPSTALGELSAGIALYGPEVGIGLITRHEELEPGLFRPNELVTRSERMRALFSGEPSPLVRLRDAHSFSVGRRQFDGLDQFAAVFA